MTKKSHSASIQETLETLPESPGVYKFIGKGDKILYIGKAKDLSKRVKSYFQTGRYHSYRIKTMVEQVRNIRYTVTNSESEALLLENNLIKEHQPKYNILLKDGKSYPYICIKNERFPRVFPTRNKVDDGSHYYGPYASVTTLNSILEMIRQNYKLRTCNYILSEENIQAGKFKVCLEYQIENCGGPCEGLVDEEDYNRNIAAIHHILKGNFKPMLDQLKVRMKLAAENLEYEKAADLKKKVEQIKLHKKNHIFSDNLKSYEVLTVASMKDLAIVTHFKVHKGTIIQTHSYESRMKYGEEKKEVLEAVLDRITADSEEIASEILTNIPFEEEDIEKNITITLPRIGEKRRLIELGLKNCRILLEEKVLKQSYRNRMPNKEAMENLQKSLHLKELPIHIECFDNSNIQGSSPVASLVVFKNGKPSKEDYRHYKIKTVVGPDDFASMAEVVYRRYKRLLDEEQPLPDLIVVDGGKGQLSSAAESLKNLRLITKIPIIGIAKRLEEIYILNDPLPLHLDKRDPALNLIQQIRNEAHRFAITFHRNLRSKASSGTSLTRIEGIGEKTSKLLLRKFRSVKKIREASEEDLISVVGPSKAKLIIRAKENGVI